MSALLGVVDRLLPSLETGEEAHSLGVRPMLPPDFLAFPWLACLLPGLIPGLVPGLLLSHARVGWSGRHLLNS